MHFFCQGTRERNLRMYYLSEPYLSKKCNLELSVVLPTFSPWVYQVVD